MFCDKMDIPTFPRMLMSSTCPILVILRVRYCNRFTHTSSRKGTASASEFKEKQANVSKNLAGYINEERAGHLQYGLGFIVSHVSSKSIAFVQGDPSRW